MTKMKTVLCLLMLVFAGGCGEERVIDPEQLQDRGGIFYAVNDEKPYSGRVVDFFGNRQKAKEITFKNGKQSGLSTTWHENGQKALEVTYKNGEREDLATEWDEDGQKKEEVTYKNG